MMTRQQIIDAAEQINHAIDSAGISSLMGTTRDRMTLQDYLKAFKQYNILAEQFSEGALFLEKELGFSLLRDPDPWIEMSKQGGIEADNPLSNVKGIVETLASISNLLSKNQINKELPQGKEVLSLILFEEDNKPRSSPRRISESLESIELLYEACARMQGVAIDDLEVLACDSGSDKLFEFVGSDQVVGAVKELILSIWERVIFYRNRKLQERISLLTHSLPVLDNVTELEMNGSLSADDGEHTRNAIVDGVTKFLSSGSMIKEIRERTTFDERSLMAPEPVHAHQNGHAPQPAPQKTVTTTLTQEPTAEVFSEQEFNDVHTPSAVTVENGDEDLSWDGILEDDLKTLRELIDKTKRSEEEHG